MEYVADWVLDDQPVEIGTKTGRLVSVPYTVEVNDVLMSAVEKKPSDEIFRRGCDQFDRLYQEGAETPKVMAISIHPYLTGVPHRIKYFEKVFQEMAARPGVAFWTGEEIYDWFMTTRQPAAAS